MFVGHVGAGLWFARRSVPAVNAGWFVAAALLQDLLLWLFLLAGVESGRVPAGARHGHEIVYVFPYSHGLLATAIWSAVAGSLMASVTPLRWRAPAAFGVAAAVASHGLLDLIVHRPQLPLIGPGSPHFGLALWDRLPLALAFEIALAALGLWAYLRRSGLAPRRRLALVALVALLGLFTVGGMLFAPLPPSITAMAVSSFAVQALVCAALGWIVRAPR